MITRTSLGENVFTEEDENVKLSCKWWVNKPRETEWNKTERNLKLSKGWLDFMHYVKAISHWAMLNIFFKHCTTICYVNILKRLPYLFSFSFFGRKGSCLTNTHSSRGAVVHQPGKPFSLTSDYVRNGPEIQLHLIRVRSLLEKFLQEVFSFQRKV